MSNHRFAPKDVSVETLKAMLQYLEKGGKVTVASKSKRPKRGYTVGKQSSILKG